MESKTKVAELNLTTKLLTTFIFKPESLAFLVNGGLVNTYLDDYGYRSKHQHSLFFLFNTNNKYYRELEKNITEFKSFSDWYDVDDKLRMLVFKVGPVYRNDLKNFKANIFDDFSSDALIVLPITSFNFTIDYSKEIYRYNLCENPHTQKRN
jgi:hypothetical protein